MNCILDILSNTFNNNFCIHIKYVLVVWLMCVDSPHPAAWGTPGDCARLLWSWYCMGNQNVPEKFRHIRTPSFFISPMPHFQPIGLYSYCGSIVLTWDHFNIHHLHRRILCILLFPTTFAKPWPVLYIKANTENCTFCSLKPLLRTNIV